MKLFGRKGKSIRIEVILAIVILLLVLCMGFGYCLRFVHREGYIMREFPVGNQFHSDLDNKVIEEVKRRKEKLRNPTLLQKLGIGFRPQMFRNQVYRYRDFLNRPSYDERLEQAQQDWYREREEKEASFAKWDHTNLNEDMGN